VFRSARDRRRRHHRSASSRTGRRCRGCRRHGHRRPRGASAELLAQTDTFNCWAAENVLVASRHRDELPRRAAALLLGFFGWPLASAGPEPTLDPLRFGHYELYPWKKNGKKIDGLDFWELLPARTPAVVRAFCCYFNTTNVICADTLEGRLGHSGLWLSSKRGTMHTKQRSVAACIIYAS